MKILIVEDNLNACERYRSALEATHEVLIATSIYDARVLLKALPDFDLIVLDGLVPLHKKKRSGKTFDMACELWWRYPHIVVVAASSDEEINEELVDYCEIGRA